MRRLLLATAGLIFAAGGAHASRVLLVHGAPVSPFPAMQTIHFDAKTSIGFGGDPMGIPLTVLGYAGGGSHFPAIVLEVDGTGAPVADLGIEPDRNMLVPATSLTGGGTYGAAWAPTGTCSGGVCYTITVQDFTSPTHTGGSGFQTIITVPDKLANAAEWREMTPCGLVSGNCATAHADSATVFQLNTLLSTGTQMVCGDTVKERTGYFNPTLLKTAIKPPAAAGTYMDPVNCGGGRITITSEVQDTTTLDADGNRELKSGGKIGRLTVSDSLFAALNPNAFVPFTIYNHWFYFNSPTQVPAVATQFFDYNAYGRGVDLTYNRFEVGPAVPISVAGNVLGVKVNTDSTVSHNYFIGIGRFIGVDGSVTAQYNTGKIMRDDGINFNGSNNLVTDNMWYSPASKLGAHPDCAQHLNELGPSGLIIDYGTVARMYCTRNVGGVIPNSVPLQAGGIDMQGAVFSHQCGIAGGSTKCQPPDPTIRYINELVYNNIMDTTDPNGESITNADAPRVVNNTMLMHLGSNRVAAPAGPATSPAAAISFSVGFQADVPGVLTGPCPGNLYGGVDADFNYNIANTFSNVLTSQCGTVTMVGAHTVKTVPAIPYATALDIYQKIFPNYVPGPTPGYSNRAALIRAFTPARGATFHGTIAAGSTAMTVDPGDTVPPVNSLISGPGMGDGNTHMGSAYVVSEAGNVLTLDMFAMADETGVVFATGAMNPDHTYAGSVIPTDDFGDTCWNWPEGHVYDPTVHCTSYSALAGQQ